MREEFAPLRRFGLIVVLAGIFVGLLVYGSVAAAWSHVPSQARVVIEKPVTGLVLLVGQVFWPNQRATAEEPQWIIELAKEPLVWPTSADQARQLAELSSPADDEDGAGEHPTNKQLAILGLKRP